MVFVLFLLSGCERALNVFIAFAMCSYPTLKCRRRSIVVRAGNRTPVFIPSYSSDYDCQSAYT